jgi:malate dehydrogenase (oxaloacetate-decarboxylating)(NADP+)
VASPVRDNQQTPMGLNNPVHFIDFESSVEDIVNVTAIDAMVNKK